MDGLYLADDVRKLDAAAIAGGIPGYELMRRAAAAALRELRARWPVARDLLVLCGGGNNGGDGYMLAALARRSGLAPTVIAAVARERLAGDAARAAAECAAAGVTLLALDPRELAGRIARSDVIVDALLGIGLVADVRSEMAELIDRVNDARRPVLALDVPSGLCADTGRVRGTAVRASSTVTFIARKAGLWLGAGPTQSGEIVLDSLGVDARLGERCGVRPVLQLLARELLGELPRRAADAHKGLAGHLLILGGGVGMPGAARLAGEAALRAGAGRVTVLAAAESAVAIAAGCPELMVRAIAADGGLPADSLATASVMAIGPGLGRDVWSRRALAMALAQAVARDLPVVLDADALNLLAEEGSAGGEAMASRWRLPARCVLTPHPGEAARLLGTTTAAVQAERLQAARDLQIRHGAIIVLKGAGTLVAERGSIWLCPSGNPAMAAPGMGDVLTGIIGALVGQGLGISAAARAGVLLHALAGELAAGRGLVASSLPDSAGNGIDRGLLASEVARLVPQILARWSRPC